MIRMIIVIIMILMIIMISMIKITHHHGQVDIVAPSVDFHCRSDEVWPPLGPQGPQGPQGLQGPGHAPQVKFGGDYGKRVAEHDEFSNGETTIRNGGIWCNQWWFNHEQQVVF